MPRAARKKYDSEALYHVIERGNEQKDIFNDEADRVRFLDIVKRNRLSMGLWFTLFAS